MGPDQLISELVGIFLKGSIYFKLIGLLVGGAWFTWKSLRFVREGQLGLKMRFGKVVRKKGVPYVVHPGFCWLIPHVDTLIRHNVRQQTITLADQRITMKDNTIWIVSAVIVYVINDIYKALFEISDVDNGIKNVASRTLREVLQHLDGAEDLKDISGVSKKLMDALAHEQEQWGINLKSFGLVDCAPDAATAAFITNQAKLKLTMQALRDNGVDPLTQPVLAGILLGSIQMVKDVEKMPQRVALPNGTYIDGAEDAVIRLS